MNVAERHKDNKSYEAWLHGAPAGSGSNLIRYMKRSQHLHDHVDNQRGPGHVHGGSAGLPVLGSGGPHQKITRIENHGNGATSTTVLKASAQDVVHTMDFGGDSFMTNSKAVPPDQNVYGLKGFRTRFSQKLITVGSASASTGVFKSGTPAVGDDENTLPLAPEFLNGKFVSIANYYEFYRIVRMKLVYATLDDSDKSQIAIAINHDQDRDEPAYTFDSVVELDKKTFFRAGIEQQVVVCDYHYSGAMIFRTASVSGHNHEIQAVLVGATDTASAAAINYGFIVADFVCDFFGPTNAQSLSVFQIQDHRIREIMASFYVLVDKTLKEFLAAHEHENPLLGHIANSEHPVKQYRFDDTDLFEEYVDCLRSYPMKNVLEFFDTTDPKMKALLFGKLFRGLANVATPAAHLLAKAARVTKKVTVATAKGVKNVVTKEVKRAVDLALDAAVATGRGILAVETDGASEAAIAGVRATREFYHGAKSKKTKRKHKH